jgi:hypothetical protein
MYVCVCMYIVWLTSSRCFGETPCYHLQGKLPDKEGQYLFPATLGNINVTTHPYILEDYNLRQESKP